jgi:hypothetical protein
MIEMSCLILGTVSRILGLRIFYEVSAKNIFLREPGANNIEMNVQRIITPKFAKKRIITPNLHTANLLLFIILNTW